ncbi:FkbM family methyltransferase [Metallosphaera javensis (ex Sakai et al. 2022)]|uniref:FkbM family methyltransferase n=1 Tax=Metallosphaera javensis (ex Sakai et al. 2022) TaxID=2775498 RepID=UPI00258E1A5B|nr:MAG: hexuronic acid methyltransferase AglP [Metallosphaera javensis (ex Sakai et al. 2022)]
MSDFAAFYQVVLENTYKFLFDNIRQCDIIIDAGTNIGLFSIIASRISGECGKVIAIEPEKINLDILKENIEQNNIKNIEIVPKALYNLSGETVYLEGEGVGAHISTQGIPVKTITLDDIVSEYRLAPRMLKMDIEGAEDKALESGRKALSTITHIEMEVHGKQQHDTIKNILSIIGFSETEVPVENLWEVAKRSLKHPLLVLQIEKNNKFNTTSRVVKSILADITRLNRHDKSDIGTKYPRILYYYRT